MGGNHQEKNELGHVLASASLPKHHGRQNFLGTSAANTSKGRTDQIKEYTLATEVLGRSADFDQNRDAIVRVEIHRLRKKLKEYYEGEGAGRSLEIVIDSGQYVPRFVPRGKASIPEVVVNSETAPSQPNHDPESPQPPPASVEASARWAGVRNPVLAVGGLILGAVLVARNPEVWRAT